MMKLLLPLLFAAPAVFAAPAFIQKEFEIPSGDYRYADGVGWEKRRAILFENAEPCGGACPWMKLELSTGYQYEFTMLVRAELAEGSIVEEALSWYDRDGRRISAATAKPVSDNEVLPDGWVRYGGVTPILPATAVDFRLHLYVCHGGRGRCAFDRFTLKKLDAKWVGDIMSDCYRNIAAEGRVRFVTPLLNFDALRLDPKEMEAVFVIRRPDGSKKRYRPDTVAGDKAEITLDVSEFGLGKNALGFELRDSTRTYGRSVLAFTRVAELPKRRVWIDARKRLIVDGRPTFVLGMYWRKVAEEELDVFCPSPFNVILPCQRPVREQFDMCARRGLLMPYPCENGYDREGDNTNIVNAVKTLKDHPALLGWYLNDERPVSLVGHVKERHRLVTELDDQHPTWSLTDKPMTVRDFLGTYDVIGTDPYPVGNATTRYPKPFEMIYQYTKLVRERCYDLYPLWCAPQAFDWGWFRKDTKHLYLDVRYPTREELRNSTWQYLAGGANGIIYYAFNTLRDNLKGAAFDEKWTELKEIAAELKGYERIFLTDEDAPSVTGATDTVGVRAWRCRGETWLLVVNACREPRSAKVTVGTKSLSYDLKPLEVVFGKVDD